MIYAIAFLTGTALMVVEIAAARLLTVYFGSGVTTWASVIGVVLGALSGGYFLGGLLADRCPRISVLGALLIGATVAIAVMPTLERWLLYLPPEIGVGGLPQVAENVFDRIGGTYGVLLAAVVFLTIPSLLLGTTSPYLIRVASKGVETTGRTAGGLYAVSTLGSIVGTLGTGFVLLPHMGVRSVLLLAAGLVLAAAIFCFGTSLLGRRRGTGLPLIVFVLLGLISTSSSALLRVIYERDSLYHRIIVEEVQGVRYLRFDASYQSGLDLQDPKRAVFTYTDYLHLGMIFSPAAKKVLFIGLGAGIAPTRFYQDYPQMTIHVVEIDPAVKEVAQKFFFFREDDRMTTFIDDGRMFLRKTSEVYDLIVLDAYYGGRQEIISLPFHLATKEFLELAKARLTDQGALVFNLVGRLEGPRSHLSRSIYKTYRTVFPEVYIFPVDYRKLPWLTDRRNLIFISPKKPLKLTPSDIVQRASHFLKKGDLKIPALVTYAGDLYRKPIPTLDVPLLTDDYAPIEFLNP
ncbi:MAG: fused MFS/spermidine synthase [Armatimonadetes bacterium]|nr:fused MFS/spermidine synthase [Armatimonadota bacterium]MDW8120841.1 fused MFS/spermidine synthase [Armatimonadota bacterium]